MVKKLARHGNSLALVIDRPVLDLLEIGEDTPLSVTTDGRCLVIAPAGREAERAKFRSILAEGNRRYGRLLKKLA